MQRVYTDEDFNDAADQRKRVARVFWIVLAVYIALAAASLIYYTSLPYKDKMQSLPKTVMFISTALFVVFLFLYMGIKYHRINKYYKMVYYLSEGLKNVEENFSSDLNSTICRRTAWTQSRVFSERGVTRKKSGCAAKRTGTWKNVCRRLKRETL